MKVWKMALGLALAACPAFAQQPVNEVTGLRDGESLQFELKHLRLYGDLNRFESWWPKKRNLYYQFDYCMTLPAPERSKKKPKVKCTFLNRTMDWTLTVKNQTYSASTTRPFSTIAWDKDGPTWTLSAERLREVALKLNPKGKNLGFIRVRLQKPGWFWAWNLGETELQLPARARGGWPTKIDPTGYAALDSKPLDVEGNEASGALSAMIVNSSGEPAPKE